MNKFELKISEDKNKKELSIDIRGVIGVPEERQFDEEKKEEYTASLEKLQSQLKDLQSRKVKKIFVDVYSPGGDVSHGLAIHDALVLHPAKKFVHFSGWSASAATLFFNLGHVSMSSNINALLHEGRGAVSGTSGTIQAYLAHIEKINDLAAGIYASKSGKEKKVFRDIMAKNNGEGEWLTASELLELGLIDEIKETVKVAACDTDYFKQRGIKIPQYNIKDNKNKYTMFKGLFGKKVEDESVQLNTVMIADANYAYANDLESGSKLAPTNGAPALNGSYEIDGKIFKIEDNEITSINDREETNVIMSADQKEQLKLEIKSVVMAELKEDFSALKDANAQLKADNEALRAQNDKISADLEKLSLLSSDHEPAVKGDDTQKGLDVAMSQLEKDAQATQWASDFENKFNQKHVKK